MRSRTGDDVSPHGLWQATMMANAHKDPFWRASVERETAAAPAQAKEIEADCLRCHSPMAHHTALLGGQEPPTMAASMKDPLALDGVSCTVCHKVEAGNLAEEASFGGHPVIGRDRAIYGPFKDPASGPMQMHSGYEPQQGLQIRSSALCGSCHTSRSPHAGEGAAFREQATYLEWRNSEYSTESGDGSLATSCQGCHMADMGEVRIARNPPGRDFLIEPRPFRAHAFVGGNAFMLDMLGKRREALGIATGEAAFQRMAQATRQQLVERTAQVVVSTPRRENGTLSFDVVVKNLGGHKLPTGYPARRMWLEVQVRAGNELVFHGGDTDKQGRIVGLGDELDEPHRELVTAPHEVPIYELVSSGADGKPTTTLGAMRTKTKDTRLLPLGWTADGPHAADTAPVGVAGDANFVGGSDTVSYRVPIGAEAKGRVRVLAYLRYQPVPPAWVDSLRQLDSSAAKQFVGWYDEADPSPETVCIGQAFENE